MIVATKDISIKSVESILKDRLNLKKISIPEYAFKYFNKFDTDSMTPGNKQHEL